MKKILLTLMVLATCSMAANAKNYDINIANVEVSDNNCNYITGGDIDSGYGVYNPSTNTLTLYNINIRRTGQDHYGIHNRKCDNLTIVFSGNCNIVTSDNALKLERSTTITAASGSNTYLYSAARIVVNLKSYTYYFKGSGNISIESHQSGYEAIKGDGINNTTVYFQGAKIKANSTQRSTLSSFTAYFQGGADLRITGNDSDASVSDVKMEFYGKETILEPFGAYYSNNSIYNSSGSQIKSGTIYISDDYVALIDSDNFPDYNFRNYLLGLYPKGYINTSDVNERTKMTASGKSISNLQGIEYFENLETLNCSGNYISDISIITYLDKLKRLDCSNNRLNTFSKTAHPSLTEVYFDSNPLTSVIFSTWLKLEVLSVNNCSALKTLSCPACVRLNDLRYNGCISLQELNCYNCGFTSLNSLSSCTSLKKLECSNNKLTSLPALPNSLQELSCYKNQFSTISITGHNNLTKLVCYENNNLTTLTCNLNGLTSLNAARCPILKEIFCPGNKLSSIDISGCSTLENLYCQNNQLTQLYLGGNTALKIVNCSNNKLSSINLSNLTELIQFDCSENNLTSLSSINCKKLEKLNANYNALTGLNVENCTSLKELTCLSNNLTYLSLAGCSSLNRLNCCENKIKFDNMTNLVNSLRNIPSSQSKGNFYVYYLNYNDFKEGNIINGGQIQAAQAKRWNLKGSMYEETDEGETDRTFDLVVGDVNFDGSINAADITALYSNILQGNTRYVPTSYVNDDNSINAADVTSVYKIILGQQ